MSSPALDAASGSTRLYLDDVPTPVVAQVARRTPEALTLSQDLHFLRLRKGARDAEGRHAELASVYLAVHGDTPRLVLELRYTEAPEPPSPAPESGLRRLRTDGAAGYRPLGVSERAPRRDETVPYAIEAEDLAEVPVLRPSAPSADTAEDDVTQLFRTVDVERDTVPAMPSSPLAPRPFALARIAGAIVAACRGLARWIGASVL